MNDLDGDLLAAHQREDAAALVSLYQQAAAHTNDLDATAFYLTHAHVFALEINHPDQGVLRARLIEMGREAPLGAPRPPLR